MLRIGGNQKLIVGYDLGWDYAQISYCNAAGDQVETVSSVAGAESFSIPTVLCKKVGVNQWYYGKEAIEYAKENQGILIENLLRISLEGEPLQIEEGTYDPVALLTLFFKRTLGMLSGVAGTEKMEALMITCDRMDETVSAVLDKVTANLRLKTEHVAYQSRQESYYQYLIHQQGDLWKEPSILFDYRGNKMSVYRMECNKKTKPVVTFIHREEEEFPSRESLSAQADIGNQVLDQAFLKLAGENNLFCKGACYGMLEQIRPSGVSREYVFLGDDKLKCNVGMNVRRQGSESYLALLDAGTDWKKATAGMEFYLRGEGEAEFVVTSLVGGGKTVAAVELEDFPGDVTRVKMTLSMKEENLMHAHFEDLGFGEFRPAENKTWDKDVLLG